MGTEGADGKGCMGELAGVATDGESVGGEGLDANVRICGVIAAGPDEVGR